MTPFTQADNGPFGMQVGVLDTGSEIILRGIKLRNIHDTNLVEVAIVGGDTKSTVVVLTFATEVEVEV